VPSTHPGTEAGSVGPTHTYHREVPTRARILPHPCLWDHTTHTPTTPPCHTYPTTTPHTHTALLIPCTAPHYTPPLPLFTSTYFWFTLHHTTWPTTTALFPVHTCLSYTPTLPHTLAPASHCSRDCTTTGPHLLPLPSHTHCYHLPTLWTAQIYTLTPTAHHPCTLCFTPLYHWVFSFLCTTYRRCLGPWVTFSPLFPSLPATHWDSVPGTLGG